MGKLIKITNEGGFEVYLNPMFIQTMLRQGEITEILLMSGNNILCKETPAEIEKKSNEFTFITKGN